MYRVMFALLILTLLEGCSKTIIPETGNQFQVVTYSQIADTARDVKAACEEEILTKDTCTLLATKLRVAKDIVDNDKGIDEAVGILTFIRSKL